ncbi:hypothetical protein [Falsihalocynthiibacter arcticus]|uniref:Uncharacterized protein n=1 Tax=Falsihalocynthiibacter arcticus TaxID=1579316 RepID=A0A126V6K1_9RHOB|nr:hypothetical protein [Falsihalocynthiibacter arcticus]AML53329.1 hypothetical protein RC74_20600 [Falsihalocynthiibacter arcticus]
MSNLVTTSSRQSVDWVGSASRLPGHDVALRCVLLLALFLSGIVPQGLMRVASNDGMMLVLCTPEGPTEAWLTDDGRALDKQPADHPKEGPSSCMAVTLSLVMVQAWLYTFSGPAEFTVFRQDFVDLRRTRLIDKAPHQPRAPPVLT